MTNITGKIYQQTNAAGTENRFPRTVIEAVYGLSSYLQTQFANLADIYMPIEGIYESKTGQEFVYRKTPNTIKAKSFTLDRIKGKTLAWNQLANDSGAIINSDSGLTVSTSNHSITINGTSSSTVWVAYYPTQLSLVLGHKYYYGGFRDNEKILVQVCYGTYRAQEVGISQPSIINITRERTGFVLQFAVYAGGTFSNYVIIPIFVDLTLLYGSAIDGMTDAEILAKFESEFPGYHSYEPGKLISNDAESIETVGFNLWDEEWEAGGIKLADGETYVTTDRIRSKNFIPVIGDRDYYFCGGLNNVCFYDSNGLFISGFGGSGNTIRHSPAGAFLCKIETAGNYGPVYNHDIYINLSDPAKNGTYEPYRKSTMQLNLGSFQVRDSQGNVTTITGGLKSAGSVYDEIVGNKYIKRVGSVDLGSLSWVLAADNIFAAAVSERKYGNGILNVVCEKYLVNGSLGVEKTVYPNNSSNQIFITDSAYSDAATFKTAMSGVYLYYGLATPIEYELVEPLVPTVKAGTTEARISPNSDGLSAPFCCDLTYSAQENSESTSSQYSLFAGQLLNTRKIWGQDFNGTADVVGALSNVTNINELFYLGSSNVGIGQASPAYKLDVSGTFRATGNAIVGGTLGVTGAATLNGTTTISNASFASALIINRAAAGGVSSITYNSNGTTVGVLGVNSVNELVYYLGTDLNTAKYVYHSGNSNKSDVDWAAKNLRLNGTITGVTSINSMIIPDSTNLLTKIVGSEAPVLRIIRTSSTAGTASLIDFSNQNQTSNVWRVGGFADGSDGGKFYFIKRIGGSETTILIIKEDGKVGIGTESPAHNLDVNGTLNASGDTTLGGTLTVGTASVNKATTLNGALSVSGTSVLTGKVGIGGAVSSGSYALKITGDTLTTGEIYFNWAKGIYLDDSGNNGIYGATNSNVSTVEFAFDYASHFSSGIYSDSYITAGAAASSSDARLKDNIEAISETKALSVLSKLSGKEWDWNEKHKFPGQHGSGLVAQEVQKVMPWSVLEVSGELYLNYSSLWGIAIPVMQSHEERISQLEEENRMLKEKLNIQ